MVKIISGPTKWSIIKKCKCSKAELEIFTEDLKIGYFGTNYGGETPERKPYFECPICGKHNILQWIKDNIPPNWKYYDKDPISFDKE
jgi:hypothetical protein